MRKLLYNVGKSCAEALAGGVPRELALEAAAHGLLSLYAEDSNSKGAAPFAAIAPAFALAWSENGFPTIEPGHRLAASLMATSVPQEYVDDFVRMPWRCFGFQIPKGLFTQEDGFALALQARDGLFKLLAICDGRMQLGAEPSLADWSLKTLTFRTNEESNFTPEEVDKSARVTELTGRLFLGLCLEMSSYRPSEPTTKTTPGHIQRATKPDVTPSIFKLTRPVNVDARPAVRDYAEGRRPANPTVQVLVRGHWKMQVHGQDRADRKLIHVEPYWRGDENAPVAVRSHVLGKEPPS